MSAGSAGPAKQVLVVDDNPVNLKITAALVRKAGFVADTAETAEAAMEHLAGTVPDLIVTDLQLPGMDGLALARAVKQNPAWRHIPTILLTAAHSKEEDILARQAGCECSIGKPVDAELFPGIIRAFLGESDAVTDASSVEDLPIEQLSKEFLTGGASECCDLLSELMVTRTFAPELDFVSIRKSLHRWAGVAGTLGLPEITRLARELEAWLATFDPSQRGDLRQKLAELLNQFLHAAPVPMSQPAPTQGKQVLDVPGGTVPAKPVILVGDDDATIRAVIKRLLEGAGFECRLAADGLRVLTMALSNPPDAIILDLNMPRINGFRVLEWLRDQWSTCKVPVILLTASHEESDILRGVELDVASYMVKPFQVRDLLARVEQAIAGNSRGPVGRCCLHFG